MKAGQWMAMIVVFIIGIILGFGIGANPAKVAGLEKQIQQLTAENAQLKSQGGTLAAPAAAEPPKKQ